MAIPTAIQEAPLYKAVGLVIGQQKARESGDNETAVADTLAEIMYWCEQHHVDFDQALSRGTDYFSERI